MLREINGDMLKLAPKGDVVVIPVNTVGIAGKGLAAWMRDHLPETHLRYQRACKRGKIATGEMLVTCEDQWWVAAFPTKYHWKNPSDVGLIEVSVVRLIEYMQSHLLETVHLPRVGCGKTTGMLDYETQVRPILEKHFADSDLTAIVYS